MAGKENTEKNVPLEEKGEIDESKLPFARATIVNMLRKHLDPGKQIKGRVKDEMNLWLGDLVEKIAKKMNSYPYTYVDHGMFEDAIRTYEQLEEIEHEKERIMKYLEKMKVDIEMLQREVDRKFRV